MIIIIIIILIIIVQRDSLKVSVQPRCAAVVGINILAHVKNPKPVTDTVSVVTIRCQCQWLSETVTKIPH